MNKLFFLSLLLISSITCFADPKIIIQTNNGDQNENQIELTQDSIKFLMQSITFKNMLNDFKCFGEIDDIDNLTIDDLLKLLKNNSKDSEDSEDDIIPLPNILKRTFNQIMKFLEPLAEIAPLKTELEALEDKDKKDKEEEIKGKESEIIQMLESCKENDLFNVVEATNFLDIPELLDYSCKAWSDNYELKRFKNNELSFDNQEIIEKLQNIYFLSIKNFFINKCFENYTSNVKNIQDARYITSTSYSPDSPQIVSFSESDYIVRIWDATTGLCLHTLNGHTNWVNSVSFSPNGTQIITASDDNTVRIWNAQTDLCTNTLNGHTDCVNSASYSPNGTQIVTASNDNTVRIWDATTGLCLHTLNGHTNWVNSVSFSPNGTQIISASWDNTVRIWDAQTGQCINTLNGHTKWVRSASYSPDGTQIVSASDDHTVRIWDAETGLCLHTLKGHTKRVESASYSPDGTQIVSSSDDHTVRIWDIGKPTRDLENLTYEQILLHTLCKKAIETNQPLPIVNNPYLLNVFNSLSNEQQEFLQKLY